MTMNGVDGGDQDVHMLDTTMNNARVIWRELESAKNRCYPTVRAGRLPCKASWRSVKNATCRTRSAQIARQ